MIKKNYRYKYLIIFIEVPLGVCPMLQSYLDKLNIENIKIMKRKIVGYNGAKGAFDIIIIFI